MATGMFSGGAAFGVFPQMQPRRRLQDPEGAANVPLDVTRGRFAGMAGLLPDVLNFMGRSPMPTEMFGETQYEPTQQLPYGSEYYLQNLPLKPTSRIGEVAGQAGAFVPLNPMPAARAVAAGARALGPAAVRMGEGYLQRQGLMPSVVEGESAGMLGGPIKPQAPVSPIGFYSAAEQAALALPRKSGTGDAFLNDLMKGQDVKKDELSWMGLDDYLKGKPNVTRQEVQDYIAGNRVDVQEVRLGEPSNINKLSNEQLDAEYQRMFGESLRSGYGPDWRTRRQDIIDELTNPELENGISGATKYQQYQLPGGENYREILLTLPNKPMDVGLAAENYYTQFLKRGGEPDWAQLNPVKQQEIVNSMPAQARNASASPDYTSSHFDQPNILAHMRVNDRIDADGKKMLLIEEVQSDWHQAGKVEGYASKETKRLKGTVEEQPSDFGFQTDYKVVWEDGTFSGGYGSKEIAQEVAAAGKSNSKSGVPDAPFKGTWHQLALKRALKYAADNGYDRVGLTTGSQQAERYNLSKHVQDLTLHGTGDNLRLSATAADGRNKVIDMQHVTPETLPNYIGKEAAQKLLSQPEPNINNPYATRNLFGLDLQIGGEGMKKYYDEIYPAFLEKQGKKYNAKTGETRIKTGKNLQDEDFVGAEQRILEALGDYGERGYKTTDNRFFDTYADAVSHEKKISSKDLFDAPIRYIDISPEMRGGVKKGQPLFTAAPIGGIGLGAGTQDNEMPDAVRQYMADPRYSDPFADTTR